MNVFIKIPNKVYLLFLIMFLVVWNQIFPNQGYIEMIKSLVGAFVAFLTTQKAAEYYKNFKNNEEKPALVPAKENMKRIVFDFDEESYEALVNYADKGKYKSLGNALRDILQIGIGLQNQEQQGFSEVVVRNPKTGDERVLETPKLGTLRIQIN